ncbi:hypothetical protein C5471_23735 [Photorhabdus tasmaniensis]|uniref:Uncharacterized protein n=2 Tax=Photorhabdus tasmaniensis TaxID=1004159 RepID=A0ABX0GQW5_9GAMM|nr:hypothetical protein [Photorhabdus tasmaniensis]
MMAWFGAVAGIYTAAIGGVSALRPLAAGVAAGKLGAYIGNEIGTTVTHGIMFLRGHHTIATEGNAPARQRDAIAHQNKSAALWGALGGVLLLSLDQISKSTDLASK